MAFIVSQIRTSLSEPRENALGKAISLLMLSDTEVKSIKLYRSSVDARRGEVSFVSSVLIELFDENKEKRLCEKFPNTRAYDCERLAVSFGNEPLSGKIGVAGFGPAGMFCALTLCEYGYKPIVFERGAEMSERISAVEGFWNGGRLDKRANVQFGEGGAGTFSDGKLTTRINDPLCARVLEKLVEFGAPEEILTKAKPHIGTDKLRDIVVNLRKRIIELGGEVRFLSPVESITIKNNRVNSILVNGEELSCGAVVLALGHSAHDTFEALMESGVELVPKAFSVGARIEHLQSDIDRALYGKYAGHPALPPAEYALSYHDKRRENDRGVYTFCMCPGGFVVASQNTDGTVLTNGMSNFDRAGKNANSAVLVSVFPEDFEDPNDPLSGIDFVHRLEEKAFLLGKSSGKAPAMLTREFIGESGSFSLGKVTPTYPLGVESADLRELFPKYISENLAEGIRQFERKIKGFSDSDSVLTAIETRSSSPVRIPRNDIGQALCAENLYPCGEGAGYAGGIMSAAVDGIKTAVRIMEKYKPTV
ncbi:MAG: NAD(P)/FAD-dependent oxidoreductase [Oscillospiraceae bacterium]|nr:NAD(P)/FAD-dependent oxidoreductase [Oscillospiraceae bacterium]